MRKDIVCILAAFAFSSVCIQPAEGVNRIMTDLLVMTQDTMATIFNTVDFSFNNTKQLVSSCVDTMLASEMTQPLPGIQDANLRSALEGLTSRFVTLCNELSKPVDEAKARIGSMQVTTSSCEVSLKSVVSELLGKVGNCSSRRINTAISQIHNCINDGVDHITNELLNTKRTLTAIMIEFRDLQKKRRDCLTRIEAARCLNDVMRDILPQFFLNTQKTVFIMNEVRQTMEPLSLCTAEIVTDIGRVCRVY